MLIRFVGKIIKTDGFVLSVFVMNFLELCFTESIVMVVRDLFVIVSFISIAYIFAVILM